MLMSNKAKEFEKKIKSEQQAFGRVTNKQLVCRNCIYCLDDTEKYGNTSKCELYTSKPNSVLLGGECELKEEE